MSAAASAVPDGVTVLDHPLAGELLTRLRDERTVPGEFQIASRRLASLLVVEATRDLGTREDTIRTPLREAPVRRIDQRIVLLAVLRAGLGLIEPVLDLYPHAAVGFLGLERDHDTHVAREYYRKMPDSNGAKVLVLEPMLATGGSASQAVAVAEEAGARQITVVSVVTAPEGAKRIIGEHPDARIVTAALDDGLNDDAYIVPGLGDYGDRLFAT